MKDKDNAFQLLAKGLKQLSTAFRTIGNAFEELPEKWLTQGSLGEPNKAYTCAICEYTTGKKSDFGKHCLTQKHLRQQARKIEPGSGIWSRVKKAYPKQLNGEDDKYTLMAFMWLMPTHHRHTDGKQGMSQWPLRQLWEVIHHCEYDTAFYMKANKRCLYSKTLPRDQFSFAIFAQFLKHANLVILEARTLIAMRTQAFADKAYMDHWEKYIISIKNIPLYLKDKTPMQKRKETMSLHEYLQMCG